MAVVNSIGRLPGFGGVLLQKLTTALSGASQQTNTISSIAPTMSAGYLRVKVLNGGGANTTCAFIVQGTDGTGTVILANVAATAVPNVASSGLDMVFEFNVDINMNSISVLTTLGGTTTTATLDFEVFGCP